MKDIRDDYMWDYLIGVVCGVAGLIVWIKLIWHAQW